MKKLFAILMVLALIAGSAFAEVSIGGNVSYGVNLAGGKDGVDEIYGGINGMTTQVFFRGESDDGQFGVYLRLQPDGFYWEDSDSFASANVWWKPIDQLKIRIGDDKDGFWGKDLGAGWGFTRAAVDHVAVDRDSVFSGAWYGGFADKGIMFEITPMDMLAINIALPYGAKINDVFAKIASDVDPATGVELADILHAFHFQAVVTLGFGDITLSYKNDASKTVKADDYDTMGDLYLAVGLNVIPNIGLGVGLGFTIPNEAKDQAIRVGVNANGDFGAFGFRARLQAILGGNFSGFGQWDDLVAGRSTGYVVKKDDFMLNFDVLPYYVVNDTFRVFFLLGLDMLMDDAASKTYICYHVNPYIEIGSEWGPRFFAGFRLQGANEDLAKSIWALPVGLKYSW